MICHTEIMSYCNFVKKYLNIRKNRKYNGERIGDKAHAIKLCQRGGKAQMLLFAGIIIAVSVIALSVISINLSNIDINIVTEKSYSILPEYFNLREKFAFALKDRIDNNYTVSWIREVFNSTKNAFSLVEMRHGNIFDASLKNIRYDGVGKPVAIVVSLNLISENMNICEDVVYNI